VHTVVVVAVVVAAVAAVVAVLLMLLLMLNEDHPQLWQQLLRIVVAGDAGGIAVVARLLPLKLIGIHFDDVGLLWVLLRTYSKYYHLVAIAMDCRDDEYRHRLDADLGADLFVNIVGTARERAVAAVAAIPGI